MNKSIFKKSVMALMILSTVYSCQKDDDSDAVNERVINIVDGLVAEFTFDNTLNDNTGNILGAKIVGGVTTVSNRNFEENKAYYLDGTGYIEIPNDSLLVASDLNFSISIWAKAETVNTQQSLLSKAFDYQLLITPANSLGNLPQGDLYWAIGDDQGDWGETRKLFIDRAFLRGSWHHYTVVFTQDNVKTYIDGLHKTTDFINASSLKNSGTKLLIGAKEYPTTNNIDNFFRGTVDELRYYNKALTHAEVVNLYEN